MKRKRGALPYTRGLFVYDENIPFLLEALKGPKIELELQLCEQHKAVCAPGAMTAYEHSLDIPASSQTLSQTGLSIPCE